VHKAAAFSYGFIDGRGEDFLVYLEALEGEAAETAKSRPSSSATVSKRAVKSTAAPMVVKASLLSLPTLPNKTGRPPGCPADGMDFAV
jgi:hypothetical protein